MPILRKYGLLILIIAAGLVLLFAVFKKDQLNELISRQIKNQATAAEQFNAEKYIQEHFNYAENKSDYDFSVLEFKSSGCTICKQMEPELKVIKTWNQKKVNVVVIQIMNPDSQEMMKYFGISAVPTHILLNNTGKEIFRKYGFISAAVLQNQMLSNK